MARIYARTRALRTRKHGRDRRAAGELDAVDGSEFDEGRAFMWTSSIRGVKSLAEHHIAPKAPAPN